LSALMSHLEALNIMSPAKSLELLGDTPEGNTKFLADLEKGGFTLRDFLDAQRYGLIECTKIMRVTSKEYSWSYVTQNPLLRSVVGAEVVLRYEVR